MRAIVPHQSELGFGPHVPELAKLIAVSQVDGLSVLAEIYQRWPGLPFRDFMAASVLAVAMGMKTGGRA